ncbi:13927_t:CDS:2, partial [Cetraspora pellucida]
LDNAQESLNGRVIIVDFTFGHNLFRITNVYAPPNPGDFNVNLDPISNRISQSPQHNDPSREAL